MKQGKLFSGQQLALKWTFSTLSSQFSHGASLLSSVKPIPFNETILVHYGLSEGCMWSFTNAHETLQRPLKPFRGPLPNFFISLDWNSTIKCTLWSVLDGAASTVTHVSPVSLSVSLAKRNLKSWNLILAGNRSLDSQNGIFTSILWLVLIFVSSSFSETMKLIFKDCYWWIMIALHLFTHVIKYNIVIAIVFSLMLKFPVAQCYTNYNSHNREKNNDFLYFLQSISSFLPKSPFVF